MIGRAAYDLLRVGLRIAVRLWPLWLFWFAWSLANDWWLDYLLSFPDRSTQGYEFAFHVWPSVALLGPILLMLLAVAAYRMQLASRAMPVAGIIGVVVATALTGWPEYQRLAPYLGTAAALDILRAVDLRIPQAVLVGLLAAIVGAKLTIRSTLGTGSGPRLIRGRSDNYGHADWLSIREARRLFPGPDPSYGGIVVGEAYRVDQDRVARRAFDPADRKQLGTGRHRAAARRSLPHRLHPRPRLRRAGRLQDHLHRHPHHAHLARCRRGARSLPRDRSHGPGLPAERSGIRW